MMRDDIDDVDELPASSRSRITNRLGLLVDGRTGPARRHRDLRLELMAELGVSDPAELPCSQRIVLDRVCGAVTLCEEMEAKLLRGESIDEAAYHRLQASAARHLVNLGLLREPSPPAANGANGAHGDERERQQLIAAITALQELPPKQEKPLRRGVKRATLRR